jgi:autotransporter-associated beta strand protein
MNETRTWIPASLRATCSVAPLLLFGLAQAWGQVATEDAFDYPTGSLAGQNGGSGWLGAWTTPAGSSAPLVATGLSYPALTVAGGGLVDGGGSAYAGTRKWFDPATPFSNGSTVWFSCLLRYDTSHNSDMLVLPFGEKGKSTEGFGIAINTRVTANASTWGSDPHLFIRSDATNLGVGGSSSGTGLCGALGIGQTVFVVGRFILSSATNADTLDVWVNQTSEPAGNSPLRLTGFTAPRNTTLSDGNLLIYQGFSARGGVDEIRIGNSYASVASALVPSAPPTISIATPAQDALFASPATIPVTADVQANGRTISKVQFLNGPTLLGEDSAAPYEFTWTGVPPGTHRITARLVYDADLAVSTGERNVIVLDNSPVTFAIDAAANRKPISPYIYGVNNVSNPAQLRELNYTLNRRGGEVETRYDYQTNSHNIAKNWYFTSSNAYGTPASDVGNYIKTAFDARADVMVAVPTIGWMPKPGTHSFSQAKYGLQTSNEPYGNGDAGIGILQLDAAGNVIPYNPATAAADRAANAGNPTATLTPFHPDPRFRSDRTDANYLPANPLAYQSGYIDTLISQWGLAANGGVRFYTLDNEPGLWDYIHRDVRGDANVTKEEIRDYIVSYGNMIRDRDPAAQILAPSEWGWAEADDYYPWLLAQLQANDTANGRRSLDIITVHYYPAFPGPAGTPEGIINLNQSTRSLWDPNWTDESWINTKINMIPTLRSWVANHYPGTKIGITEYNWSMTDYDNTIAGAVIQAEVLGIFGREGLDLATRWGSSANNPSNLIFKAMKMYRNYDDLRSSFGDTSISSTTSANPDEINAFAAERSTDGALTIMAVNKQIAGDRPTTFALSNFAHRGIAQAWRLDAAGTITRLADLTVSGNSLATTLPPQSITIYVLPTAANLIAPQVTGPAPADASVNVPISLTLGWNPSANASLYHLYLGTNPAAVAAATTASPEYLGASATPDFDLTSLAGTTTYHWRVDAEATGGTTAGTVWSFTTAAPPRGVVTLTNGDAFGTSSYNSGLNWSNAAAPSLANDYFTSNKELRSPVGASGTTTFGGYSLSLDSGGTLTTKGENNNTLAIDRLFLNGGRIRVGDQSTLVTISGSTAQVLAASTLDADQASRTLVLASPLTGSGRLTIASGTAAGGLVRLAGTNDAFTGPWTINPGAILQVGNGGTTGSLGSGDITLNGSLIFNRGGLLTLPGDISGSGSITLDSGLALTLEGASTYSGPTTVTTGSLFVTGSLGSTPITISLPATLGGAGTFGGPVTVQGILAPGATGQNSIGHLAFGNDLTLAATTDTRLELNRNSTITHDALNVAGSFTAAGTLAITNAGPPLVAGDAFTIFSKAPTAGSFSSISLPALDSGLLWQNRLAIDGTLSVFATTVDPATNPAPADEATAVSLNPQLAWTAGANALSHRIFFGTDETSVTNATTASPEYRGEQSATTWNPGLLDPATTYFWRIQGIGAVSENQGLTWSFTTHPPADPASAPSPAHAATGVAVSPSLSWTAGAHATSFRVFFGTNAAAVASATTASPEFKGEQSGTTWSPGTLAAFTTYHWRIDSLAESALTPGPVWSFTTGAIPLGTVTLDATDSNNNTSFNTALNWDNNQAPGPTNNYFTSTFQLRSPHNGSGNFTFAGASLTLNSGGSLLLKGLTNSSVTIPSLILAGGTIQNGTSSSTQTVAGSINVTATSTLDGDRNQRTLVISAPISGSGNLTAASLAANGGTVRLTGNNDAYSGNWTINSNTTLEVGSGASSGSLGSGNITNNNRLVLNRTGALAIPGDISGGGTLESNAALDLTLAGNNSYTGSTTINAGRLIVTGTLGNTAVTIGPAASLSGAGNIGGSVTVNGALTPGTSVSGPLTIGGSLALTGSSVFEIDTSTPARHDSIAVTGTLTAGGTLTVTHSGPALVAGDSFPLFNKAYTGGFTSITLPALTSGLVWQNDLATTGTLTVAVLPVGPATNPVPAGSATDVPLDITLSWTAGANAVSHAIYFGTDATAVANATPASPEYQGSQPTTTWQPAALAGGTTYFWRIDETGVATTTAGPVWSFTTAVTDPYLGWAQSENLTPGVNDAHDDDPDHDGVQNLIEFILGGDPLLTNDSDRLPKAVIEGTNLKFTFDRDDLSEPGTTLIVQYGGDLVGWTDVPIGSAGGAEVSVLENGENPDLVNVLVPVNSQAALFVRLKASRP